MEIEKIMVLDKVTTRYVSLMLTHKCNLNCTYCYENFKDSQVMDVHTAKYHIQNILTETFNSGNYKALELGLMGGEPLLEFCKIKEICEWMWSCAWPLPYIVFASTNGTLLTDEMKQWFKINKNKIVLGISLDGSSTSQFLNRGVKESAIDISFFIDTWPDQGIKATISRASLRHLADDIIFLHEKGFKTIYSNLAFGIDWEWGDLITYKNQLLKLIDFYIENPELERCSLLNLDLCHMLDTSSKYKKYCGCGEGTMLIDTDGEVYPCPVFSPISLSKERIASLKNIDFSNPDNFIDRKCRCCLLRTACPKCYGMSYKETGNPAYVSSFNCVAYKIQVLANCILQRELLKKNVLQKQDNAILYNMLEMLEILFNNNTKDITI